MARSVQFDELLIESLKDQEEAVAYFNTVLQECGTGDQEAQKLLLIAIKVVAEAQGGIAQLAEKTGLGRESLYKTLSQKGNPKLSTLTTLFKALGFDLMISPSKR